MRKIGKTKEITLATASDCTGCTACVSACPRNCLKMQPDEFGFLYPVVCNKAECVGCKKCENVCPILHGEGIEISRKTAAYAAFSLDSLIRIDSSSGGIFTEIATEIMRGGGVVFGASYDDQFNIQHICVDNTVKLDQLRGAKYAQGRLEGMFPIVRKFLNSGRNVLFVGLPCQVAGLKFFLEKDYLNLFCIDFVCHGVPSPGAWHNYVRYRSDQDNQGKAPQIINLRAKESGWSNYSYSVLFDYASNRYLCKNVDDIYMKLFVNNYILRESCASCHFKGYERCSDITLGDFWGIWDIYPQMDDNRGTSLVLSHTGKGREMIDTLLRNNRIKAQSVSLQQTSLRNPSLVYSSSVDSAKRKQALKYACDGKYDELKTWMSKDSYDDSNLKNKIKNRLKRLMPKS